MARLHWAAVCGLLVCSVLPLRVEATTQSTALQSLGVAIELCLLSAVPPTVVRFERNAAGEPCRQAEGDLFTFQSTANRNRQLACSGGLMGLKTDLLLISIYGGTAELADQALGRINHLQKICFHYDVAR
jgi:hypothetical protein